MSIIKNIKQLFGNSVLQYIFSRYFTYGIQFINSIFIAISLGPFYLGIWGFINLVVQYFAQINFGIPSSLNVIASKEKDNLNYVNKVFKNSIVLTALISCLAIITLFSVKFFKISIGDKYKFDEYLFPLILIVVCNYFILVFSNFLRILGNIRELAISQSILPLSFLLVSIFFKEQALLWALLYANIVSLVLTLWLFIKKINIKWTITFEYNILKEILYKGFYLFIYNSSFYLIIISTRSIISYFYSVSEFGYFTFSFTLGNTVNLLLASFSFLIFPKILNRFAKTSDQEGVVLLNKLRKTYIISSHFLVYSVVLVFPLFLYFFPRYQSSLESFRLVALTIVLYSNAFGYQGLLMAKGKEKLIALLSFVTLLINILLGFSLASIWKLPFSQIIIATAISYGLYIYLLGFFGRKVVNQSTSFFDTMKDIFPFSLFVPYGFALILSLNNVNNVLFLIPLILFIILNVSSFNDIKNTIIEIIKNPKIINI